MLWTCSSPLRFHQIIKDSNCLSSENRHFNHNLYGLYALNWKESRECSDVLRYSDPPIAGAGVCDKSKEVGNDPLTEDGVSGYGNKLQREDSLSEEKLQKVKLQCLDLYQRPQVSILQLKKGLGHLISTIQTVLPARLNNRFLQQKQIQALKEKKSCLANITLNNNSKHELLWRIKNLEIFNRTSLLKQVPQLVLQSDASLTGWGAALHGKSIGRTWSFQERK